MYSSVIFEKTHETPCHPSPHGSPPTGIHPSSGGEPREVYKLFIAEAEGHTENKEAITTGFP